MSTQSKNGATVPVGSDPYALTADLLKMMESAGLVYPVPDQATRDAIPSPGTGMVVSRLDRFGVLEYWDGDSWEPINPLPPFGHMGVTGGFTASSQNPVGMAAAQVLLGGMTFSDADDALVVPRAGLYEMNAKIYTSGGGTGLAFMNIKINGAAFGCGVQWTKQQVDEYVGTPTVRKALLAGDKVSLQAGSPSSIYGTDGYNGTWLEVKYVGPASGY